MTWQETQPSIYQAIIHRFVADCEADERVVAAFLGGSYASGAADAYSDVDLYLITTDDAYDEFFAGRKDFVQLLSEERHEPVFLENYHAFDFDLLFFIFSDLTHGELGLARESRFDHIHGGPFRVLVDKKGILASVVFPKHEVAPDEQTEKLRRLIYWFWHDLLQHFITSIARGHLWSAYGALEDMRRTCVNLARLRQNFSAEAEGYEKVENAIDIEQLSELQATFCPLEKVP